MHPPAWPLDADYDGVVNHAVYDGGGDDGIAKVIAELGKPYVRGKDRRGLAVAAVYDFEEQGGIPGILLLKTVKAHFIDEQDIGRGVLPEFPMQTVISPAGQKFRKHRGRRGIAAPVELPATNKKQCLGDIAFPRARVPGHNEPLFAPHEVQFGKLHDLGLIQTRLEFEIEIGEKLALRKLRFLYPSFYPPFYKRVCLYGKKLLNKLSGGQRLLHRL